MKVKNILTESFEFIKINGVLHNLSNDEMKIYKKVKESGKLFKSDLDEFDQRIATSMVSKGLLKRKKSNLNDKNKGKLYFVTKGRKGILNNNKSSKIAPPDNDIQKWIKKNKNKFQNKYGDDYENHLYSIAWKKYNGKKTLNENAYDYSRYMEKYFEYFENTNLPLEWIDFNLNRKYKLYICRRVRDYYATHNPSQFENVIAGVDTYKLNFGNTFLSNDDTYDKVYTIMPNYNGGINVNIIKPNGVMAEVSLLSVIDCLLKNNYIVVRKLYDDEILEPEDDGSQFNESYVMTSKKPKYNIGELVQSMKSGLVYKIISATYNSKYDEYDYLVRDIDNKIGWYEPEINLEKKYFRVNDSSLKEPEDDGSQYNETYNQLNENVEIWDDKKYIEFYKEVIDLIDEYIEENVEELFRHYKSKYGFNSSEISAVDSKFEVFEKDIYNNAFEGAVEMGNYDVYDEILDRDATKNNIDENISQYTLIDEYGYDYIKSYIDDVINSEILRFKNENNVSYNHVLIGKNPNEITWDGSDETIDNIGSNEFVNIEYIEEIFEWAKELKELCDMRNRIYDKHFEKNATSVYLIDEYIENDSHYLQLDNNLFYELITKSKNNAYESAHDYFIYNKEYNEEATNEAIYNVDDGYLILSYADESLLTDYFEEVKKYCKKGLAKYGIEYINKTKMDVEPENDEITEPEDDGSQFNESYNQLNENEEDIEILKKYIQFYKEEIQDKDVDFTDVFQTYVDEFEIHGDLYDYSSHIDQLTESLIDHARDEAVSSGDYDVYNEELDGDETWNNIYDEGDRTLIDRYMYSSEIQNHIEEIYNDCVEYFTNHFDCNWEYALGKEENTLNNDNDNESLWDGSDETIDNIGKVKQREIKQVNVSDECKKYAEDLQYMYELSDSATTYSDINNVYEILDSSEHDPFSLYHESDYYSDDFLTTARDRAYESGDYNAYNNEYNSEATWDAVNEESYDYIIKKYAYDSKIEEFFVDMFDYCKEELGITDDSDDDEEISTPSYEDELAGSEFDESKEDSYNKLYERYIKKTSKHPKYNVEYNDDYIEFEPGMRYVSDDNIVWTVKKVKPNFDTNVNDVYVIGNNGESDIIPEDMLNIRIVDEDGEYKLIYDDKFFNKGDLEGLKYISEPDNDGSQYND